MTPPAPRTPGSGTLTNPTTPADFATRQYIRRIKTWQRWAREFPDKVPPGEADLLEEMINEVINEED